MRLAMTLVLRVATITPGLLANTTVTQIERLFNETIRAMDHRCRPTLNQSQPTQVHLGLTLLSLLDLDEVQQSMTSNVVLSVTWIDQTRHWEPQDFGGLTRVHPEPLDIWRPRLFLSNSIAERDMFEDDYSPLTVSSDGFTEWLPGGVLSTYCPMKMTYFPFDIQTCTLTFTTGEDAGQLQLLAASNHHVKQFDTNGKWLIDTSEARTLDKDQKYTVKFIFTLNRLSSLTMLNVVIPVNIISSLSCITFLLPAESGERVSFSITVLLSLTVYSGEISKDLPTNSESLPLLIIYLTCLLLHSGLAIVANQLVLIRSFRYPETQRLSRKTSTANINTSVDSRLPSCKTISTNIKDDSLTLPRSKTFNQQCLTSDNSDIDVSKRSILNNRKSKDLLIPKSRKCKKTWDHSNGSDQVEDPQGFLIAKNNWTRVLIVRKMLNFLAKYVSAVDLILSLLFFVMWLVITLTFMIMMTNRAT